MRISAKFMALGQANTVDPYPGRCAPSPGQLRAVPWSQDTSMAGLYKVVVALTVTTHLAFIAYVIGGGFLALRWRRSFWLHAPVGLWGMTTVSQRLPCPLTELESRARAKAGMPTLPSEGFVGRYISGVIFPASWLRAAEIMVFVMVLLSWTLFAWRGMRGKGSAERTDPAAPDGTRR